MVRASARHWVKDGVPDVALACGDWWAGGGDPAGPVGRAGAPGKGAEERAIPRLDVPLT